ncbi:MAG: HAMP domain-containing histidine kinase [Prevotellaceae bacterium]|nr:HAMP domain-containing histidine kinase [Prevotellaceae bacterium]
MYYSNRLAGDMAQEERQRIELWAEATHSQFFVQDNTGLSFITKVINENTTIPVIVADAQGDVVISRNVETNGGNSEEYFRKKINEWKKIHEPIEISLDEDTKYYFYYDDSTLLKQLSYYPYVQWSVIAVFFVILFIVFTNAKKSEQDRVWVGLSKETAHQLGTPISSLLAWVEILKSQNVEPTLIPEMEKDVNRLRTIAERFSKIGSKPEKEKVSLNKVLDNALAYMQKRTSNKVQISCVYNVQQPIYLYLNVPLFEWVIENLSKNAIDAMEGEGKINISVTENNERVYIDVQDTGKGIPKSKYKTVFKPGYTTKKRGWGLGLSLVKRIIEEYHGGKIFVKKSEQNKGTTFRIILNEKK